MAGDRNEDGPKEGELLVCTVSNVKQNGAYVKLDAYEGLEGFIFIGEIASGWVKNIRGYVRDGQRVVCKVLRTKRRDRQTLDLSLKSVSEERKRDTLQAWKNDRRAIQLLKVLGEKVEWSEEQVSETEAELRSAYGSLYGAFEDAAGNPESLSDTGFEGDWIGVFVEMAVENIIPPFVEIRAVCDIQVGGPRGVEAIREALCAAETHADAENEVSVLCYYDGAPKYRVEIKAPDYKLAEKAWDDVSATITETIEKGEGTIIVTRE